MPRGGAEATPLQGLSESCSQPLEHVSFEGTNPIKTPDALQAAKLLPLESHSLSKDSPRSVPLRANLACGLGQGQLLRNHRRCEHISHSHSRCQRLGSA